MDNQAIRNGLTALARAGARSNPYLGHFGTAMLAGHFLCKELTLSSDTISAIRECLPVLATREPGVFNNDEENEEPIPELINRLREYLLTHVGRLNRSGHVAIVGMYALKALRGEPDAATPNCINGIIRLLDAYGKERPSPRYYGYPLDYNGVKIEKTRIPKYKSAKDAFALAVSELRTLYPNTEIDGVYYYFVGEKLHGLTHAHALYELEFLGEHGIAEKAYSALRHQMLLNRVKPPNTKPIRGSSLLTPEHLEFWKLAPSFKQELGLPHALKRSYTLLRARQAGIRSLGKTALQRFSYVLQSW